jgi:hypothetical protein
MAKTQEKYGFQGPLAKDIKIGDATFQAGQSVEFGPYDTASRRDAEAKMAAKVFAEAPRPTVILTCSSVAAFREAAAPPPVEKPKTQALAQKQAATQAPSPAEKATPPKPQRPAARKAVEPAKK